MMRSWRLRATVRDMLRVTLQVVELIGDEEPTMDEAAAASPVPRKRGLPSTASVVFLICVT